MAVTEKPRAGSPRDEVLMQVGEHVRAEQKDDARFERVARGDVDASELAELERAAKDDPELALRLEASRPLGASSVDRIVAHLGKGTKTLDSEPAAKPEPKVVPLPTKQSREANPWRRRIVLAAGPLALAAAMLVYVTTQHGPSGPELPSYAVTASGEQAMRGPASDTARLHLSRSSGPNARFEIVLRPATAPLTKVVAFAFLPSAAGAEANPLEAKVEIASEGSVRLTGSSRALDGASEIRIVVGAPAAIGKFDDAAARATTNRSDPEVRVVTVPIDRD